MDTYGWFYINAYCIHVLCCSIFASNQKPVTSAQNTAPVIIAARQSRQSWAATISDSSHKATKFIGRFHPGWPDVVTSVWFSSKDRFREPRRAFQPAPAMSAERWQGSTCEQISRRRRSCSKLRLRRLAGLRGLGNHTQCKERSMDFGNPIHSKNLWVKKSD